MCVCCVVRAGMQLAILNANYMAKRLEKHYNVLFKGSKGQVCACLRRC